MSSTEARQRTQDAWAVRSKINESRQREASERIAGSSHRAIARRGVFVAEIEQGKRANAKAVWSDCAACGLPYHGRRCDCGGAKAGKTLPKGMFRCRCCGLLMPADDLSIDARCEPCIASGKGT